MKFPRSAGVLLHPTSLPGSNGIGELGPDAFKFVDFLTAAGFKIWQMLPLGPTGYGDSPYQCFSAFAGNPLLIHVPGATSKLPANTVDFEQVIAHKRTQLAQLFKRFVPDQRYVRFVEQHQSWLHDFALFTAIKNENGGAQWTSWDPKLAMRNKGALEEFGVAYKKEIEQVYFEQYLFYRQFEALKQECTSRGIQLMGDLPIYVAHDSADVWANRELFQLDEDGHLIVQAGVPPDYFSETGQLWGNPIYNWDHLETTAYAWWIERMRAAFTMFDLVRLDHFRGFEAFWQVPGDAVTAIEGQWVKGPGAKLFDAITAKLGPLPIIAENLGLITPEVETLRKQFDYPGMSILQFAFGSETDGKEFRPHNLVHESVVYTGTHDNDTTVGWWNAKAGVDSTRTQEEIDREHAFAERYLDSDGSEIHWTLMRAALSSVANTVLIPMQDILGLGNEARMNLPGRQGDNWRFRFEWNQLTMTAVKQLRELIKLFDR